MQALTFFFAFVAVLALIGAAAWLVRRFAGNRLGANTNRGRAPRLAVIDAAAVDGRRRLVLVRRDNVEHLLMIGGPTDIVVEPNIVRASPARDSAPPRPVAGELPRIPPHAEAGNWPDADGPVTIIAEPHIPEPPPRPARPAFADEMRRPAAPAIAERRSDPLMSGFVPEPLSRPEPRPEPRVEASARPARSEPPMMPRAPRPAEPAPGRAARDAGPGTCRRLRQYPRRPRLRSRISPRLTRTSPTWRSDWRLHCAARPATSLRNRGAESAPLRWPPNRRRAGRRRDRRLRHPCAAARSEPPAPRPAPPAPPPSAAPKTGFENLEDEMASLLGRPKTPS